jgi:hypothetical protein
VAAAQSGVAVKVEVGLGFGVVGMGVSNVLRTWTMRRWEGWRPDGDDGLAGSRGKAALRGWTCGGRWSLMGLRVSVRKGAMVVGGRCRSCQSGWTKKEE